MKKSFILIFLLLLLCSGCDGKREETENRIEENNITMGTKLVLKIDQRVIPVNWEENDSVMALVEYVKQNPLKIQMSMYGGWEQVGALGTSLTSNDVNTTAVNGDIMLYSSNQIVLFYGPNTWAYTHLGKMDLTSDEVTELLSQKDVVIEISIEE